MSARLCGHLTPGNASQPSSQSWQACVLRAMFAAIGTRNRHFVEVGFNEPRQCTGSGSNTCVLWRDEGWQGLLLDGANSNASINLHKELVYSHNIVALLEKYGVPKHLDYVSIDVDSTDIWLVEALLRSSYRPRIISAEFNPNYPFNVAVTFPDHTQFAPAAQRTSTDERLQFDGIAHHGCYYGASMRAFDLMARAHGYALVAVVWPLDVFLAPAHLAPRLTAALESAHLGNFAFNNSVQMRHARRGWPLNAYRPQQRLTWAQARELLDWEVWQQEVQKGRSVGWAANEARRAAQPQLERLAATASAREGTCFRALGRRPQS